MTAHVAVIMGGWSAEREVSLVSGKAVALALRERGYRVTEIDVDRSIAVTLQELQPDVVFNALHGRWGEDGCIQGLCEILRLAYTHSGVAASAVAMNKPLAKRLFAEAGIPCPEGQVTSPQAAARGEAMDLPFVMKPINEGSSVGISLFLESADLQSDAFDSWSFGDQVLVERYIPGREITVAVMADEGLGATEIRPREGFYDYDAKYTENRADHLVPAPLGKSAYDQALDLAARAHRALGCRGVTRADFRYDDTNGGPGGLYMLEVNTQPGMTPLSLVPEIAAHRGISFGELVEWMVEDAGCDR